jgi:aminoglycoside phosphotransferase (APT) family kinase protein
MRPASDILPDRVARTLGISSRATLSAAPHGMTSHVTFVDDDERPLVLKQCRDTRYVDWLRREHGVLIALAGTCLPIPRVVAYHERQESGALECFLLTTRLPGASLWDVLLQCPPGERARHLQSLGRLLRELHATPVPAAFRQEAPWIDRRLRAARQNLGWCDGSDVLLGQLAAHRPPAHEETLIHGDLALDNVLLEGDSRLHLLDWSEGDRGDPRNDVALALATEPELHLQDRELTAFFDGYGRPPLDPVTAHWFVDLYEFF